MHLEEKNSLDFSYLESLNPAQREAVETLDGAVLVLAGAGTGKTKALTARLAHLLTTRRAYPSEILSVTFTNKAALEMQRRVSEVLGGVPVAGWWLGTFHALAARMLRRHAELVGLKSNFSILDSDDQIRLMKQLIEAEGIDIKNNPPRLILSIIQRWKDRALLPDAVTPADAGDTADGKLIKLYRAYQNRLQILNACDFGDLLLHMIVILRDPANAAVLDLYQSRFKYILVDEYQDTNVAQYLWLRLLAQKHKNICCVGDDDQSIYAFRGAEVGNILKFDKDFEGAKIIRLEQNYRSTGHILGAANAVIACNKNRLGKNLWSADAAGEKVTVRGVWDGPQEAAMIAEQIEYLQRQKVPLNEIAILVRAGHQTRSFEECFIREAIPYRVIGGLRFYERQEIRDAIAYLRLIVQQDDDLAFERIINVPKRGLGDGSLQPIRDVARAKGISLLSAVRLLIETQDLKPKPRETLRTFVKNIDRWRLLMQESSHTELVQLMLEESGYIAMWKEDKTPEAAGRLENIKEFAGALNEFESLESFLEHVSLVMERQDKNQVDMVSVMTLHGSKGLEFDVVFLPGWEEDTFPSKRSMDESGLSGLEEERRLAYVGITRARKKSCISFAVNRMIYGSWTNCSPSRFIDDLPPEHIEVLTDKGISSRSAASPSPRPPAFYVDQTPSSFTSKIESESGFCVGDRVVHAKFGSGKVLAVDNDKLDIDFKTSGRKKLVDSFVRKE